MNAGPRAPDATTRRPPAAFLRHITIVALIVLLAMQVSTTTAHADVGLGTTDSFAVLAGETITNAGSTTITGDVGLYDGSAVTGFDDGANSVSLDGTLYVSDAEGVAQQAKDDLVTAYDDAAGRSVTATIDSELDGANLGPGVYESDGHGAFLLSVDGTLTLSGDADDVWIFQSGSGLTFMSGSEVVLDGADPCNVFWQVTSSATLGTSSTIVGTIMALTSISLDTGATLDGRALARNGEVTMDTNTITNEDCTSGGSSGGSSGSSSSSSSDDSDDDDTPLADAGVTTESTPVETPTRVDTGGGGAASPSNQQGVLLLAVAGIAVVGTLLRRTANSG